MACLDAAHSASLNLGIDGARLARHTIGVGRQLSAYGPRPLARLRPPMQHAVVVVALFSQSDVLDDVDHGWCAPELATATLWKAGLRCFGSFTKDLSLTNALRFIGCHCDEV